MELQKGKWYKSDTSDTPFGVNYVKYNYTNVCEYGYELWYSNSIHDTKYSSSKDYWNNSVMINALELLTDLTEIQKYLPDGHEDKVNPKFIKGKWYKSITTEYLINYMKYSHHDGDKVYHTEKIVFGEYYNKTEYWNNSIMVNALELLTDLTEIQQYLPDGHDDKVINKFIKGKWYKSDTLEYGISYMKYTHHDGDKVYCTDSIEDTKHRSGKNYWINSAMINVLSLLTDLTEIQEYLPDGHEDKVNHKFIKGKWYKHVNKKYPYIITYMRYSHSYNVKIYCNEQIHYKSGYSLGLDFWANPEMIQDLILLTDLTEIQEYLPDGHEDKVKPASAILGAEATKGFLLPKSERYLVTIKFFKQLKEPERSEAIENYDENFVNDIPINLNNSLMVGFDWTKSKQGSKYWNDIRTSIEDNTYFKEPEVFGEYKIGDIVVSLIDYSLDIRKGGLFIVTKESTKHLLIQSNDWRLATLEEAEAYNSGIRNINDIKEPEVFGKYNIGDIVVSLTAFGSIRIKGDIFVVRNSSNRESLCYAIGYSNNYPANWRLATLEEAEAYRNGIRNINDIKEPEVLVFGKYKIGDIVVSITELSLDRCNGNMYKVLQKSDTNNLFYRNSAYSTISNTWRLATQKEIFEYNKGIRNVNDIVKKGDWIVLLKPIQGFDVGKLYPVTDMSGDRLWKIQGMNCQIDREYYRKATKEECIINDNRILNLNIKPRNTIMKIYVEITADMNDGDYTSERTEIDETWISKFQPLIDSIIQNDCNWSKGECVDTTFLDQYDEFEEDLLNDFDEYVPYGEYGVHSISGLVILKVESENRLM